LDPVDADICAIGLRQEFATEGLQRGLRRVPNTSVALTLSLCNVPPWVLGSREFNEIPEPLELQGVRYYNRRFFQMLDALEEPALRARAFEDYLTVKFRLHEAEDGHTPVARRSLRNDYLRYLRGWGVESSSVEGAVLKAWVESRFGLAPSYHRGRLLPKDDEAWLRYAEDRMRGSARTNAIYSQFDLVYEFCQYELKRQCGDVRWLELFRGTNDSEQYELREIYDKRRRTVRLNSVGSFARDIERAWEFGSTVWKVRVPVPKILYYESLCSSSVLRGEGEVVALGGDYLVEEVLY
jgi:NAD+--dinitrogen-reductase ADP-D-ribosyltransferase